MKIGKLVKLNYRLHTTESVKGEKVLNFGRVKLKVSIISIWFWLRETHDFEILMGNSRYSTGVSGTHGISFECSWFFTSPFSLIYLKIADIFYNIITSVWENVHFPADSRSSLHFLNKNNSYLYALKTELLISGAKSL